MSAGQIIHLSDRALLWVSGEDARKLLQGLVTAEMSRIDENRAGYGALLTPQGKILFDFFIMARADGFLFDCAAEHAEALAKRLTFYKLRAKVGIAPADPSLKVYAVIRPGKAFDELSTPGMAVTRGDTLICRDPRLAEAGLRLIADDDGAAAVMAAEAGLETAPLEAYHAHRITLGLADSGDIGSGEVFPHECNMDQLHGVDFEKGCFVGQEVVSRMQHRGTARSRMVPVSLSEPVETADVEIRAGDKPAGKLLSRVGTMALALLRLDRVAAAGERDEPIKAGDITVTPAKPDWAGYRITSGEPAE